MLDLAPSPAGMHVVAWLPDGTDDRLASAGAAERGVEAPAISQYYAGAPGRAGLVLGYAAVPAKEARAAVRRLAAALGGIR